MTSERIDERPHVLLVEDDRDTREMYSQYLSDSGLNVSEAATGRRGLECALSDHPDVVVTDIAMPEMDGIEMTRRLRQLEDDGHVPIIAVSGQASDRMREAGADIVIDKPCEPDVLLHAIEDVLKR